MTWKTQMKAQRPKKTELLKSKVESPVLSYHQNVELTGYTKRDQWYSMEIRWIHQITYLI